MSNRGLVEKGRSEIWVVIDNREFKQETKMQEGDQSAGDQGPGKQYERGKPCLCIAVVL